MRKERTVLIFRYPLVIQHLDLVWIKKVVNYIEQIGKILCEKLVIVLGASFEYREILPFRIVMIIYRHYDARSLL